jgi:hypothetical protein
VTNTEETGWFVAGVATVIGTLASAVAFLFKLNESKNAGAILALTHQVELQQKQIDASEKRHDECQDDRRKLATEVAVIREHVKILEANQCKIDGKYDPSH